MLATSIRSQRKVRLRAWRSCLFHVTMTYAFTITPSLLQGQMLTPDEIVAKNVAMSGGTDKWAAVQTIKMEGTYVNFSDPTPFTLWRQRPDLYRFDSTRMGLYIIHAYDGEKAWWVHPFFGPPHDKPGPIPTKNNLDKVTLRDKEFEPVFWNYEEKGHAVELLGKAEFDDQECYKLGVTLADSSVEYWFIDPETFLVVGMTGETYDFGFGASLETFFSDYREVSGITLPFLIESEYGTRYRRMEIDSIEINGGFDPAVFIMPDSLKWTGK